MLNYVKHLELAIRFLKKQESSLIGRIEELLTEVERLKNFKKQEIRPKLEGVLKEIYELYSIDGNKMEFIGDLEIKKVIGFRKEGL